MTITMYLLAALSAAGAMALLLLARGIRASRREEGTKQYNLKVRYSAGELSHAEFAEESRRDCLATSPDPSACQ